jgi:hypothetical protein
MGPLGELNDVKPHEVYYSRSLQKREKKRENRPPPRENSPELILEIIEKRRRLLTVRKTMSE